MKLFDDLNSIKGALSKAPDDVKSNFNKVVAYFSKAPERTVRITYSYKGNDDSEQDKTQTFQIRANSDEAAKNSAKGLLKGICKEQEYHIKSISVD